MAESNVSHLRGTVSVIASESIAVNLLVEDHTTVGQISLCPANGNPMGVNYAATIASAARGDVQLLTPGDVVYSLASGAITVGDYVASAASGKVVSESATKSANTIGTALTTGTDVNIYWRMTR